MVTGAGWRGRGATFQLQRSHREKSLPGRGAASSHVGPGAGSVSRGWWGVSPGPYRPGLRSPGVRAGGVRLSRPRCLMAVTGVVAPPSPPRGGGSRKAQAWPRRRQGQVRLAVQTPLPSAVPSWARARPEPPLSKDSARGVLCVWQTSRGRCRPPTRPSRPACVDSTSAGGGRHLAPGRSGSLGLRRDLCE